MRNRQVLRIIALAVIAGVAVAGCQTSGQSAATGAILGGLAGGLIGDNSGEALAGALIGAAVGGFAGWYVGKVREEKLASKEQVETEVVQSGGTVDEPTVNIEDLKAAPTTVAPGQKVDVVGVYTAYGPSPKAPEGRMRLMRDGKELGEGPIEVTNVGRSQFTQEFEVPEDMQAGTYIVEVEMQHGESIERRATAFTVA